MSSNPAQRHGAGMQREGRHGISHPGLDEDFMDIFCSRYQILNCLGKAKPPIVQINLEIYIIHIIIFYIMITFYIIIFYIIILYYLYYVIYIIIPDLPGISAMTIPAIFGMSLQHPPNASLQNSSQI